MKQLNTIKLVLSSALLSCVCLASVVSADDTEIFFGQSKDAFNTNPNVLFLLDTSGSMGWYDGQPTSRMDQLKVAMRILLQQSSSFNVGLMGFSGSNKGGSIRYPIGDLEGDSSNLCPDGICADERVVVKPNSSSDDATQNDDTLEVTLDAPTLIMAEAIDNDESTTTIQTAEVSGTALAVAMSAENELEGGATDTRAITTSSNWFFNGTAGTQDDRHAYRFENVAIPPGATVTSAALSFTQTNSAAQVGNLSALIKLELKPNPEELPNGVNLLPTIAERLAPGKATAEIAWNNIPPNTTGIVNATDPTNTTGPSNVATTPDLSDIVNTIINLTGWESGNALSFIFDPVDEYNPTDLDVREFLGIDAVQTKRPVLNFTYSESIDNDIITTSSTAIAHLDELTHQNTNVVSRNLANPSARTFYSSSAHLPRKLAFRFDNLDIPSDAVIQTAALVLTGAASDSESDATDWEVDLTSSAVDDSIAGIGADIVSGVISGTSISGAESDIDSTAMPAILTLNITAENTGTPAPYNNDPLATRDLTNTSFAWEELTITPNEALTSPNLAAVVSAVINGTNWSTGDDLSLVLSASQSYNNVVENSALIQSAVSAAAPQLQITWKAGDTTDNTLANSQTTAIRFQNVHIPPEAIIKSARLVFKASKSSIGNTELEISAENNGNSDSLMSTHNNIGNRLRTAQRVPWVVEPWDIPNVEYNSPDIKSVIQSVVDLTNWCGGNPLTIFIKKTGGDDSRHAISYDQNEVSAPTLEITYAPDSVSSGAYCSNATLISSIDTNGDDATQDNQTGDVDLSSPSLDTVNAITGNTQVIGLRFQSIGVPKDATIVSATLELTHEKDITQTQAYALKAVSTTVSPEFNNSSGKVVSDARPTYDTTVTASVQPGVATTSVFQIDVASLIDEKITDENWVQGNQLVLTVEALDGIAQSFHAFNGDETRAPQLVIYYQSERTQPGTRFRDNMIEIVDDMVAQSGTPIVGSYFEASQYFLGKPVDYGKKRGNMGIKDRYHRVSHPGSYVDGIVNRRISCQDSNLNAIGCIYETISADGDSVPTYISPIQSECQQNHIVLLSDGAATSNSAANKVKSLTGASSCVESGDQECGLELAEWLHNTDVHPTLNGIQNITTHTIAFNLNNPDFLRNLAISGGGDFHEADSSGELLNAFQRILNNVSQTDTSFVAPSATVSQSNRLKNRDDIYFSLFKPEGTARWEGNLKRYRLGVNTSETADILDVNGALAVDDISGRFFSTAKSYWSDVVDGDSVLLGGAAEKIETNGVSHLARNVYTYTGVVRDLTHYDNQLVPENTTINRDWLQLTTNLLTQEYVTNLLKWAHGKDDFDIDGDGDTEEARGSMGDPMHSQPLLVNYADGRSIVHVTTNEGFLHAIDHETGRENFAFIPKELLKNLRRNYQNEPTRNRPYGLDGGMTLWIDDENNNGIVDAATDKAILYIGMRRGGNLYYALDITNPDSPQYLWSIQGGATGAYDDLLSVEQNAAIADGDFSHLGQTWSKPIKTKIYDNNEVRDVLIFGAGYDENQDPVANPVANTVTTEDTRQTRSEDSVGRGFFIVDASSGELILHTKQGENNEILYSVPSELRVIDINFDGLTDQIYFGDMGGQVWRFDYNNDKAQDKDVSRRMAGGLIGSFADDTPESARRFYYPPDIALLNIDGEQQLSISIGSGWRAHPLNTDIEDRFYHFRMTQVYGVPLTEDGQIRYPVITENLSGMIELTETDATRTANKTDDGWFLPMRAGEKVLSSSVTVDGNILFTSYVPDAISSGCSAAVGSGAVYYIDAATGNPVRNLDTSDEPEETGNEAEETDSDPDNKSLNAKDRRGALPYSGIPPEVTVLFPEKGKATAFVGRHRLDEVKIETLKQKTFWQEYIEENL